MLRLSALVPILALLSAGCFSSPGGETPKKPPTLVAVSPNDFLGDVPCAGGPGSLQRYVVRLFDHGTPEEPRSFELPASVVMGPSGSYEPVPCTQTAVFGYVAPPHKYSAIVEAYDRTDLHALGPGSAVLVDAAGKHVAPRWTTRCGRDEAGNPTQGAVVSAQFVTRFVRGCEPLVSTEPATETALTLSVSEISGAPGCGSAVGQIERFKARFAGNLASAQEAACGETIVFGALEPGAPYGFELLAYEAGRTTPSSGTTCFGIALMGATSPAKCDVLQTVGAIEIDVETLFAPLSCGSAGDITSATAVIPGIRDKSVTGCGVLRLDLKPSTYDVELTSARSDGTAGPSALCSAVVEPGLVAQPACALAP